MHTDRNILIMLIYLKSALQHIFENAYLCWGGGGIPMWYGHKRNEHVSTFYFFLKKVLFFCQPAELLPSFLPAGRRKGTPLITIISAYYTQTSRVMWKPLLFVVIPRESRGCRFQLSVRPPVRLSVRLHGQAISPKIINGKFLNCTCG